MLGVAPGKPRDVHSRWWWVDHPDGSVSYVTLRSDSGSAPNGHALSFRGETEAAALEEFEKWRAEQGERVDRNAARRARWGPQGAGKMT